MSISQRSFVLLALGLLMISSRSHYFVWLPDASWAVFFIAGFYLNRWRHWVFLLLTSLALLIDWQVISAQGINFWQHYCISIGYAFLLPAYFVMWAAGQWLRENNDGTYWRKLSLFLLSLSISTALCHLLAQSGFYWFSQSIPNPTLTGWLSNYYHWLLPYLAITLLYTSSSALIHLLICSINTRNSSFKTKAFEVS